MYRRDDPRLRRTLNQFSHNVESATEHAQENLYTFSQNYINPCLSSIGGCFRACVAPCFPTEDDRRRRQRGRSRGRAELSFDFYDDWDEEENDALLGWGNSNDELDRLLAGSSGSQPGRERGMSYGTHQRTRRKSTVQGEGPDPNIITASHYFGFLDRLPWKLGRKGLRYKPSAADLQEHPGAHRNMVSEEEPLIEESDEEFAQSGQRKHKRHRSLTANSGHTTDSLSSRGDLFPSEDEDDAVPLDDEFAMALERRTTNSGNDESGSGRSRPSKSKSGSRLSIRTLSSKSARSSHRKQSGSTPAEPDITTVPTLSDLKAEEERVRLEEEESVERKRSAATRLAVQRGLSSSGTESKPETPQPSSPSLPVREIVPKSPSISGTFPFPAFDPPSGPNTPRSEVDLAIEEEEAAESEPSPAALPPPPNGNGNVQTFRPAALPRFSSSPG